jgi:serine/threonine protein kinase
VPIPRDDRWRRVGEILEAALEQPAERVDAFLAEACGGDGALEAEVRSLLASHHAAGAFLEPGRGALDVPRFEAPAAEPLEGRLVGAWRVVRPVGEGGMGTVYLAERGDGQFRQQGALKLIRRGLASEEMIRRFRRERQILASLDHPGIARLVDGGSTPEGLPWLVMEFVEGKPLYAWCSEQRLPLAARLRLFLSICAAVQAAHQRLVLHRDIKPGNILITADGLPRLMDFGIAKIFAAEGEHETQDLRTIALPLTPEYASPEQLRGEEVTTASDIYSLGVLLFEMLTGSRPYPTRAEGTLEMIRVVLEHDPPRPSTAVAAGVESASRPMESAGTRTLPAPPTGSPQSLRRRLSGDLDNIVLKAMAKEPERRYPSVDHLAEDIRRFLDGRPVTARPATWSYRAGKFVRRNRLAVAAAALALAALAAGLASTSWQASVARRERDVAERRLREVQSLANALLFDVHDSLAAVPGTTPVREMVVTKATEYLDRVAADAGSDSATRFGLGDAYARLGMLQGQVWAANVGKADEAYESFQKCLAIREALLEEYPNHARALFGVMQICTRIGLFDLDHGREKEALPILERALACTRRLIELFPDSSAFRADLPKRLNNVGLALMTNGKIPEGLDVVGEAIRVCEENGRREPEVVGHRRALAGFLATYLEGLLQTPGMADSAIAVTRRSIAIYEGLSRENPGDADLRRRVAAGYYDLARIYAGQPDRLDSAVANAARTGAIIREVAAGDPGNEDVLVSLAIQETGEGLLRAMAGETGDAEEVLRRAVTRLEAWAAEDTADTRFLVNLVDAYVGLGLVEISRAREAGAGSQTRDHWLAARRRLGRAQEIQGRLTPGAQPESTKDEGVLLVRSLAACDSALGALP